MQATTREADPVEREIRISARPETIFPFFTDPAKMMRWKGLDVTLDPQPGGIYRVDLNGRDIVRGAYIEIVPYSRVVFTWGWEGQGNPVPPGSSTVEVTLVADGNGTLVRLRHLGLPPETHGPHAAGWDHYLPRMVIAVQGGDPGPDPWAAAMGG
jgi:uncharacterized protein YndB with AHSA1/START domain